MSACVPFSLKKTWRLLGHGEAVAACRHLPYDSNSMDEPLMPETNELATRPATAPDSFAISARAFASEDRAQQLGSLVGSFVRELSRHFDLSRLDGVTVAYQ